MEWGQTISQETQSAKKKEAESKAIEAKDIL